MSDPKKRPSPELPEAWLHRAESDLALARHAANAEDVLAEDAMYHTRLIGFEGEIVWNSSKPNGQPRLKLDVGRARDVLALKQRWLLRMG